MKALTGGVSLLAFLGTFAIWFAQPVSGSRSWERALAHQQTRSTHFELKLIQRATFAAYSQDVYDEIERNQTTLEQASRRLLGFAQAYYPAYLDFLEPVETGPTMQEKVAQNILGHFRSLSRNRPDRAYAQLMVQLETEIQALIVRP